MPTYTHAYLQAFIQDCASHADLSFVLKNMDGISPVLQRIYLDKGVSNDDPHLGHQVIETGVVYLPIYPMP